MQSVPINNRVRQIKNDPQEINRLVEEYKPFIAACAEKTTGRYMRYGEDDELTIAMMAFVEAIRSYNILKGSFLGFARNVISRRIIDYYRKQKKHEKVISISAYQNEENESDPDLTVQESIDRFRSGQENDIRRLEIQELKRELEEWGITFNDLVSASPKQEKTRRLYNQMTAYVLDNTEIVNTILSKKYLPVNDIVKGTGIPRKKIERARKYIIAVVLIFNGDYDCIREYVDWR